MSTAGAMQPWQTDGAGVGADASHSRRLQSVVILTLLLAMSFTVAAPSRSSAAPAEDAGPGVAPSRAPRSEQRAVELLRRVAEADRAVAYSGVQYISAWGRTRSASAILEVQNVPGQGTLTRVRGSGAGAADASFTAGPAADVVISPVGGPVDLLAANYTVRYGGAASVAGRSAKLVDMYGQARALAARFWVDRRTGLLLRRELYDDDGRTVRASAFVQVRTGPRVVPSHLPPMAEPVVGQTLTAADVTALQRAGWSCPSSIAGELSLYDTREVQTASGSALHMSYSDGLSTVSVFQQIGTIGADAMAGYERVDSGDGVRFVRVGISQHVVWSAAGSVYYVVADAPQDVIDRVISSLPAPREAEDGMLDRLGRGLTRVGSWVNPFA